MPMPDLPPVSSQSTDSAARDRLAQLECDVRRDLERVEVPLRAWVQPRLASDGQPISDVVIVGAGLSGLAIAFGLRRQGIERVRIIDAAPPGREGPWITTARMRTLRSPKTLSGPDLGIPSLTYRAWHEAVFGAQTWAELDKVDRCAWMDYLNWFRQVTGCGVENNVRLTGISGSDQGLELQVDRAGRQETILTRKLVLATGMDGCGTLIVPRIVSDNLPADRYTHSGAPFDTAHLAGKDIGVIGSATSSFDWAVVALEAGARSVTLLARSTEMPRTEVLDWTNFPGFLNNFAELDPARRYRFARRYFAFKVPPTQEMFDRAFSFPAFRMVLGAPLEAVGLRGDKVHIETGARSAFAFDHLLLGTGYSIELEERPELAGFVDRIALWRDRFRPEPGEEDALVLAHPYLGAGFELTEREPGTLTWLKHIHMFNYGAVPSLGPVSNGITGVKAGVPRLVGALSRALFLEDADLYFQSLDNFRKEHFDPGKIEALK